MKKLILNLFIVLLLIAPMPGLAEIDTINGHVNPGMVDGGVIADAGGCTGTETLGDSTVTGSSLELVGGTLYGIHVGQLTDALRALDTINLFDFDSTNNNIRLGLYSGSTTVPSDLVVDLGEFMQSGGSGIWHEYTDDDSTALSTGVEYWIAISTSASSVVTLQRASSGSTVLYTASQTYGAMPDTFTSGSSNSDYDYNVYLEADCQ